MENALTTGHWRMWELTFLWSRMLLFDWTESVRLACVWCKAVVSGYRMDTQPWRGRLRTGTTRSPTFLCIMAPISTYSIGSVHVHAIHTWGGTIKNGSECFAGGPVFCYKRWETSCHLCYELISFSSELISLHNNDLVVMLVQKLSN